MRQDVRVELERLRKALEREEHPIVRMVIMDKIEELEKEAEAFSFSLSQKERDGRD